MQCILQYYGDLYTGVDSDDDNASVKRRVIQLLEAKARVVHICVNVASIEDPALTTVVLEDC